MQVKGVFFDLYGTLMIYNDNAKAWADWISTFYKNLKNYGLTLSFESFANKCDGFFKKQAPPLKNDGLTTYERRIQRLCHELGLNLTNAELGFTANSCLNAWHEYVSLDPETIPVLKKFKKNKKIALISNFDYPPHIYSILKSMDLQRYFDSIVISGEVGVKKPDPGIFHIALKELNLRSDEIVYIGDAPEDIQGANAAHIQPILIQRATLDQGRLLTDYKADRDSLNDGQFDSIFRNVEKISNLKELFNIIS
ncbi:MAG: HAD family hydrolase [Promethearchaeota archaeon]